jgi:beta-N-acetylhexosaminidase
MDSAASILKKMTLREKIAQTFLQYFQGYEDIPERFKEMNRNNELGGFIFFSGNNVRDLNQLRRMTQKIQSYRKDNVYDLPFLLTIDQEGGQLTAIFNQTTIFPGNMTLGFANDESLAYQQGQHVAKELNYAGINVCYAPVLDVDYDVIHQVPIVDNRRFSTEPEVVAHMGSAFIKGMEDEGVLACGKHFPGMRITEIDTHFKVDKSPYSMERLESVEILPFKTAIKNGLSCIMTHHGIFDGIDPSVPASLSKKTTDYLRDTLDFKGLVVTDDLVMKAILHEYGEKEPIKMAINAGADLIISTCASEWYIDFVEECVRNGSILEERINESVARILSHKEVIAKKLDVNNSIDINSVQQPNKALGDELSLKIAKKGILLYKGKEELLPLSLESKKLGIIYGNPARLVMSDATNLYDISLKQVISEVTNHKNIKESIMPWHPTDEEIISLADVAIISDVVIVSTVNCYKFVRQIEVLKEIRKYCPSKLIIGIASRSPMDATILSDYCDYVIVTGGITESIFKAVAQGIFLGESFEYNEAKALTYLDIQKADL